MNILIINAFGKSETASKRFKTFCEIVDSLLRKIAHGTGVETFFYTHRNVDQWEDFAYNLPENSKANDEKKRDYRKNFEKIDIAFIDGIEDNYLPWKSPGYKLLHFVALCQSRNKILFAAGVGMLHLIYVIATGMNENPRVEKINYVNSNGDFPTIEDLHKIPIEIIRTWKKDDWFLDNVTGDIYELNESKWTPIMNIGIHKLWYAEKFKERGKFVLKEYKKNNDDTLISSIKKEIKSNTLKQYCWHWLTKDIPVEFTGRTTLTWYQHDFCVNSEGLQYKTICQSNYGATVIEHWNSVGTLFHIMSHFKETVKFLENFIHKKFNDVQNKTYAMEKSKTVDEDFKEYPIFRQVVTEKPRKWGDVVNWYPNAKSKIGWVSNSTKYSRTTKNKSEAPHCGFSFNNRNNLFIINNSVENKKIKVNTHCHVPNTIYYNQTDMNQRIWKDDYDYLEPRKDFTDDQWIMYYKKKAREICKRLEDVKIVEDNTVKKVTYRSISAKPKYLSAFSSRSITSKNTNMKSQNDGNEIKDATSPKKDKVENESVLKMLFPYINEDDFVTSPYEPGKPKKTTKPCVHWHWETKVKSNFTEKYKKYDKELNTFGDKPSIRCSSGYITSEEAKRREFIESKKQWVGNEDFHRVFGIRTTESNMREETKYWKTNATEPIVPYENKNIFNTFRNFDKTKWISKKNFIV